MAQDEALSNNDVFGFALNPDNFQDELSSIAVITAAVFVLFTALAILVPKSETSGQTEGKPKTDDRLDSMLLILWLPLAPLLVYWANVESFTNIFSSSIEQRLYGVTPEGASFLRLYIALQILGTLVECVKGAEDTFILVHHVSSLVAYLTILNYRRSYAYAAVLGLSETTTIFLNLLLFTKHRRYKDWCAKYVPWLQPLSGTMLWLTWIPYRLVLFAAVFWWWAVDMVSGSAAAETITTFETFFYPSEATVLWVLSVVWFRKIHRGMMKTLFGDATKKK